jgi:hypothetical protein
MFASLVVRGNDRSGLRWRLDRGDHRGMCRNITTLRGLEPPATSEEVEAAARQYVRKVSGITRPTPATDEAFERAVARIASVTAEVLRDLPPRRQPPGTVPPLRRPEVRARMR